MLVAANVVILWQFLNPLIKPPKPIEAPGVSTQDLSIPIRPAVAVHIEDAHLFGTAPPAAVISPAVVSNGPVTVEGIVYSNQGEDSVALLTVSGDAVICHVGTQLATGQTVTAILPDSVQLAGPGGTTTAMLDIKQADPNQRFRVGLLAAASGAESESDSPLVPSVTQASADEDASATPSTPVSLIPTHYVSLQSLRGHSAITRFQKLNAPTAKSGPHQ